MKAGTTRLNGGMRPWPASLDGSNDPPLVPKLRLRHALGREALLPRRGCPRVGFSLGPKFYLGPHLLTKLYFVYLHSATPRASQIIYRLTF